MTHDELIKRAFMWLKNVKGCSVVVSELVAGPEIPDVIGWHGWGSILVEAKVSIADFHADQKKSFRRMEDRGLGILRYYIIPEELHDRVVNILPEKWGLLVCKKRGIHVAKGSMIFENDFHKEVGMLLSLIRRISTTSEPVNGVGVKRYIEELSTKNPKAVFYADTLDTLAEV